jgi:signal transduction histidine kinase
VFHQQRDVLDEETRAEETQQRRAAAEVQIGRRLLEMGALKVPVVVFAADVAGADGTVQRVELGLRRETVALEEKAATDAIASMFRVSLVTVSVAFLASAILVAWMMHREAVRERRQREQEHLAFAGMLANGVVHDFRNPMSSLRLDLQMLGRALGTEGRAERVRELVARMGGTVDRMDKVFREFQYVSRPDREEQPHAVALRPCLNNCLSALAARFERKKLRVELRVADDVDGVRAYESALNRALVNVLTNAEQFSPEGATVEVDAAVHGHRVVVRIMDRGPGIPPADENRIFDMFVSSRPGGTGLGLFLARTALERAGGGITVKNRPEGGAEFRLELPAAAAAVSAPGEERQEA